MIDWRVEFSKWWLTEFKTIKIPSSGSVFNYFIDPESKQFLPWSDLVPLFELNPDIPLQVTIILFYKKINHCTYISMKKNYMITIIMFLNLILLDTINVHLYLKL